MYSRVCEILLGDVRIFTRQVSCWLYLGCIHAGPMFGPHFRVPSHAYVVWTCNTMIVVRFTGHNILFAT